MLTEQELVVFKKQGYVVLQPDRIFTEEDIANISHSFNMELPDYMSFEKNGVGEVENELPPQVRLSGSALRHRQLTGKGSIISEDDTNALFGKRGVVAVQDLNDPSIFEHEKVVSLAKSALEADDIILHNGSFGASYPGNTGNAGQLHSDTVNYCDKKNSMRMRREGKSLINVMIYLDDVLEELAPLRVLPESHKFEYFQKLNNHVAVSLKKDNTNEDHLSQDNWIYDELIEDVRQKEKKIIGLRGTVILMNSSLLHGATENVTASLTRRVIILNYGNACTPEFRRHYNWRSCRKFLKKVKNKKLVRGTFSQSASLIHRIIRKIKVTVTKKPPFLARQVNRVLHPAVMIHRLSYLFTAILRRLINVSNINYLNIGGGQLFSHFAFINLDYEVKNNPPFTAHHDMNERKPLPFKSDSFKGVYTSHSLEHLLPKQVEYVLFEALRVLRKDGTIRITVPDIGACFKAYEERNAAYFSWLKSKPHQLWVHDKWLRVIVRMFAGHVVDQYSDDEIYHLYESKTVPEFIEIFHKKGESMIDKRFLEPHSHKSGWSYSEMAGLLKKIGFSNIKQVSRWESRDTTFLNKAKFNNTQPKMSFFIDASK